MKTYMTAILQSKSEREPATNKAQHSPLPWRATDQLTCIFSEQAQTRVCTLNQSLNGFEIDANAKLIVRAVNHADKLAEALRVSAKRIEGYDQDGFATNGITFSDDDREIIKGALAAYEAAQ